LLTFKIKLPLEGLDELTPDPERQRAGFRPAPVQSAV